MAVRIMAYVALLYQGLLRSGQLTSAGNLPPVVPVVLYNGRGPWTAALNVGMLVERMPGVVVTPRPRLSYLLIDEGRYTEEQLAPLRNVAAALFRLENSHTPTDVQLDVLRCKTPAMVRKEIWGHLLVYNLLRAAMAQAALGHGVVPRQVSLQGTRQTLAAFYSLLAQMPSTARESIVHLVLRAIARHRVGTRPDRYEPRACKRRPKPYPLLRIPRQQARARVATAA